MALQSCFINLCFAIFRRYSIGLRSGEFRVHSNSLTRSAWKNFCMCLEVWCVALSCWRTPSPWGQKLFRIGSKYAFKRLSYLVLFIILLIGRSLPSPTVSKLAQNIFFGTCLSWLLYASSNVLRSTSFILKIYFVWKQDLIPIFYSPIFVFYCS